MTIYIIGPITGKPDDNLAAFQEAKARVRLAYPDAHILIPHDLYTLDRAARACPALCWSEAMAACLPYAESADIIVALPGWRESRGATIEERHRTGRLIEYAEIVDRR